MSLALIVGAAVFGFTSCSDEDSLPNVDYDIAFSGATLDPATGTLYVVQGDTLTIDSIGIRNLESNKNAAITGADYYWDYRFIGPSPFEPFGFRIPISENVATGAHNLTIQMGVVAVDKEPAIGIADYTVMVVPDSTDIPS